MPRLELLPAGEPVAMDEVGRAGGLSRAFATAELTTKRSGPLRQGAQVCKPRENPNAPSLIKSLRSFHFTPNARLPT